MRRVRCRSMVPLMTSAPGRARRSDSRRNRTAILEAAARALRSADDLQLREVAEAAGVSRSTLHRHFSSRAALEEELRAAAVAELRRTIAEALTGERPPLAVLRRLVLGLVRVATERRLDRLGGLPAAPVERAGELERLAPPGRLGTAHAVPRDIARVLDEIPPHLFPEQFVAEARRVSGNPVALYVLDIDGTHLRRLAGPEEFPARLDAPLALGPELAEDGVPDLRARLEAELPGVAIAPMWLRGRAVGLLLGLRAREEALLELARHGAAAMELARGYTDVIDAARRRKETQAAAELQQSMLPARIARMGGGELAGSVLPSYEVGGDWFDYVENRDAAWIAIADAAGKGPTAGALGGIGLAALRAARRSEQTLEEAAQTM